MTITPQNLVVMLVFGASVLFLWSLYLMLGNLRLGGGEQIKRRVHSLTHSGADAVPLLLAADRNVSTLDAALFGLPGIPRLARLLRQAGVSYGPGAALVRCLASGLIPSAGIFAATGSIPNAVLVFVASSALWLWRLSRKRKQRKERLVRQLPDALDFFARALRAGNPFVGALKAAPEEMQEPIASEFATAFEELNYGLEFEEALKNFANRVDAEEFRFFVTAVLVQKTTGGNLAEIMNRISSLLRERIKTRGEVQVQAAEMKLSANVLIALPFFMAGVLQLLNPGYFMVLFENPLGRYIIYAQLGFMLVGYLVIRKMVNFRI